MSKKEQEDEDFLLAKVLQADFDDEMAQRIKNQVVKKQESFKERNKNPNGESNFKIDYSGQTGSLPKVEKLIHEKNVIRNYEQKELDLYYEEEYNPMEDIVVNPVSTKHSSSRNKKYQPVDLNKFSNLINLSQVSYSGKIHGRMKNYEQKQRKNRVRRKDVSDRSTVENVMDHTTRMIIFKLINRKIIGEVNGCVSTGKEANVYYAKSPDESREYALKVYKTSILKFKDREKYVEGEFRFQNFSKSNPRKMVKMWAEKEMRNLKRLEQAGLNVPKVIVLRQHILVMEFIGKNGWPARLLKNTNFSPKKYSKIYKVVLKIMRTMFQVCKLVHADFSEYNIMYQDRKVYVIDVSQSVEFDHPNAIVFLKMDCENVKKFFEKKGVKHALSIREMFEFITQSDRDMKMEVDKYVKQLLRKKKRKIEQSKNKKLQKANESKNDKVFKGGFMPQKIEEIDEDLFEEFKHFFTKKKYDDEDEVEGKEKKEEKKEDIVTSKESSSDGSVKENELSTQEDETKVVERKEEDKKENKKEADIVFETEGKVESSSSGEEESGEMGDSDEERKIKEEHDFLVKCQKLRAEQRDWSAFLKKLDKRERKKIVRSLKRAKRKVKTPKFVKKRRRKMKRKGNKKNK